MSLTPEQIVRQSTATFKQWGEQWKKHAKRAADFPQKTLEVFEGIGAGRACLMIANGASFEKELETIKKYQGNVDIFVCDKTIGHCLDNGIVPTYCLVADANVSYEKYLKPWKDKLQDTILFSCVCANPEWWDGGNWKDIYFYALKDSINTEKIFLPLSGCPNVIPAGTNVSNSMIIFATQCDNEKKDNFFGYDKYLLIGFDYSWRSGGKYYAFDHDGKGKRFYMRHNYGRTIRGDLCYTSNNLGFSLQWIQKYIDVFHLPIVQCSGDSVLPTPVVHGGFANLEKQMKYQGTMAPGKLHTLLEKRSEILKLKRKLEEELHAIRRTQYYDFMGAL